MSANFSGFLIYEIFCAKEVLMLRFCSSLAGPSVVYYRRSSQLFKLFTVKKRHRVYVTTLRTKSSLAPYYSQVGWEVHVS
jgi:hypothetical protein